jgi:hypothetical protein
MTLREELKERLNSADELIREIDEDIRDSEQHRKRVVSGRLDLLNAIAALEPVPADEQPELFEDQQEVASEQLASDHALPPSADDVVVEEPSELFEAVLVEERPALNAEMQDEREQPVEDGYAPVTNPEADAWSAPVETTPGTLTEYVPPTNPDADFWARGITEQPKPEPFRLASIFRREKEDA